MKFFVKNLTDFYPFYPFNLKITLIYSQLMSGNENAYKNFDFFRTFYKYLFHSVKSSFKIKLGK
jgi:hypothetical protein